MDYLSCPSEVIWNKRQEWFEGRLFYYENLGGGYFDSEQASALIMEVQACYCTGAWIAVIVLCFTAIDAQLRETEISNFKGNSKVLLESLGFDERFQELRKRRNRIMHIEEDHPAITVDQQWAERELLEREATEAVELMLEAVHSNPLV